MKALEKNIATRVKLRPFVVTLGVPLIVTAMLYLVRLNDVSVVQFLLAFALLPESFSFRVLLRRVCCRWWA